MGRQGACVKFHKSLNFLKMNLKNNYLKYIYTLKFNGI